MTILTSNAFSVAIIDSSLPSWTQIPVGTVQPIPATNTISNVTSNPSLSGSTPRQIINAWNGMALGKVGGIWHYVLHGGGHGDYAGNEVVGLPLDSDSPTWKVLASATPTASIIAEAAYNADGKPNISHTRSTMTILNGVLYRAKQAGVWKQATSYVTFDSCNLSTGTWRPAGYHPDAPGPTVGKRPILMADEARNLVWMWGDNSGAVVASFNPVTNTWTTYSPTHHASSGGGAALSPERDEIFGYHTEDSFWEFYDLGSPNAQGDRTGYSEGPSSATDSPEWDSGRSKYVMLSNGTSNCNVIWELDPTTKTWSQRTFTGTYPTSFDSDFTGHFNRLKYVSDFGGYVYCGKYNQPTYFYKSHA